MTDSRILAELRRLNEQGVVSGCFRCPVCERAGKFSVTFRDGLALYCCHRASCGVRGVHAIASDAQVRRVASAFTPRPLTDAYVLPPRGTYWHRYVEDRIDPADDVQDWSVDKGFRVLERDVNTCVWEIRNAFGDILGHQTRTSTKRLQTWRVNLPWYGYWGQRHKLLPLRIVIVEDAMSAALCIHPAVALLGTQLTPEVAKELSREFAPAEFLVALDPDALSSAIKVSARLQSLGLRAQAVPIPRDVKDMTRAEQLETFGQC